MRSHWMNGVLALALAAGPAVVYGQTVSDQLEKASYQEKTAGDLDAAIKIYQSIIQQEKTNRPAVAQAYYRMGLCLVKKGDKDKAADAFKAVVNNYSDQKTLASAAQKELGRVSGSEDAGATQPTATRPAGRAGDHRDLLDAQTRADLEHFDQSFGSLFGSEPKWRAASEAERAAMVKRWMVDAKSTDFQQRTRAIASLGNVRAKEAAKVLLEIVDEPMSNQRPKWLAIRALGRIGDPAAVPTLIELVDYGNKNVQVYARAGLADITGVYFGQDKEKWRQWLRGQRGGVAETSKPESQTQPAGKRHLELLDAQTRADMEHFDQSFASWFGPEPAWQGATEAERAAMIEKWIVEVTSSDFRQRTRAIAGLGNVRARKAIPVLLKVVNEEMGNQRPKWMAIRALGRIGAPAAVPALVELVDFGNKNVQVYARVGLVQITGVCFGQDKEKWREWWKANGGKFAEPESAGAGK